MCTDMPSLCVSCYGERGEGGGMEEEEGSCGDMGGQGGRVRGEGRRLICFSEIM